MVSRKWRRWRSACVISPAIVARLSRSAASAYLLALSFMPFSLGAARARFLWRLRRDTAPPSPLRSWPPIFARDRRRGLKSANLPVLSDCRPAFSPSLAATIARWLSARRRRRLDHAFGLHPSFVPPMRQSALRRHRQGCGSVRRRLLARTRRSLSFDGQ